MCWADSAIRTSPYSVRCRVMFDIGHRMYRLFGSPVGLIPPFAVRLDCVQRRATFDYPSNL